MPSSLLKQSQDLSSQLSGFSISISDNLRRDSFTPQTASHHACQAPAFDFDSIASKV